MLGPWVEKYRPQTLDDVVGQKHIVSRLKQYVEEGSMPNLMFTGPAGVGKTTSALALVKSILGEYWRQNFLELNASDARGIETVRTNIKNFCRLKPVGAPFRIIFLDEVDNMTKDAQHALRREMEMYTKTASFILSCNYSSKIIFDISHEFLFAHVELLKVCVINNINNFFSACSGITSLFFFTTSESVSASNINVSNVFWSFVLGFYFHDAVLIIKGEWENVGHEFIVSENILEN